MQTIRNIVANNQLISFFVLTFVISWGAVLALLGPDGIPVGKDAAQLAGTAILLGPGLSALLLTLILSGRRGIRSLFAPLLRWRVGWHWYGVALLTAPFLMGSVLFGLSLLWPEYRPVIFSSDSIASLLVMGIVAGITVAFFEELGWSGFAVPRLLQRHSILVTGVIVGAVWGLWHAILFWEAQSLSGGLALALLLVRLFAWLPPYRVLMTWVYARTESLFVTTLMHASLVSSLVCFEPPLSGEALLLYILVWAGVLWFAVAAIRVFSKKIKGSVTL